MKTLTTKADLERKAFQINEVRGTSQEMYTELEDGTLRANVGHVYLSGAFGGWRFEMVTEGGGATEFLVTGYVKKHEAFEAAFHFLHGYRMALAAQLP